MARKKTSSRGKPATRATAPTAPPRYCAARFPPPLKFGRRVEAGRARLIEQSKDKWMNGTTLRYWFFDKPKKWTAPPAQKNVVRKAFKRWKALGIGLDFVETADRASADVRIAFDQAVEEGSWSYIGKDIRRKRKDPRTMNFGWDLVDDPDTALHEIGHTLGFPHEHQNPFAGIKWNEPAVYKSCAGDPNYWSKTTTFQNIIEKIQPDTVQGSSWDPNSVMHYPFEPGLIEKPVKYRKGLTPAGGLSKRDKAWAFKFYPPLKGAARAATKDALKLLESTSLSLAPGQQANFTFRPDKTRPYEIRTFGDADTIVALYEKKGAKQVQIAEDDDSGTERNAHLKVALKAGAEYVVRVRLHYAKAKGKTAIMVW